MLYVHRAERADSLVRALADLLAEGLDDPFDAEVVAVPTRGVERWLTQQLSLSLGASPGRNDGVCANVEFPFPGRVIGAAVAAATGVDPDTDPWRPERVVWPLLDVVAAHRDSGWLSPLLPLGDDPASAGRSGQGTVTGRRGPASFATVRHVADLFDRYGVHRPDMMARWAGGVDDDGQGVPIRADAAWQVRLWRLLREQVGVPSPGERLVGACVSIRDDPSLLDLPRRLSFFGLTRLPASYLDIIRAVAANRDVHLFLLHASPELWNRIAQTGDRPDKRVLRRDDPTAALARNPLLAAWGQDTREMQVVLDPPAGDLVDVHHALDDEVETASLLHRLQADVRADRCPPGAPVPGREDLRHPLNPGDRSVQVHACHGRGRQVEVLRDALLHLFETDTTLEPRDVIVMCPDVDSFAPLIDATFGSGDQEEEDGTGDPGRATTPEMRVRLADRSLRQTNPLLAVVSELLALVGSRCAASQVMDLASRDPVRFRFDFSDDDLARIEDWVARTGIRWGIDGPHRAPFKLESLGTNTWSAGLDRLLLGVTMPEEGLRLFGGVLPFDDIESGDIELAGRLAELVDRLRVALDDLVGPRTVSAWAATISSVADALTGTTDRDGWQRSQLDRILDEIVEESMTHGAASEAVLSLDDVRELLADRLRGRPTRANFRTGHLTVCTLVPMRSVPHRVVCLLGLDDGVFPRKAVPDGDDLVRLAPRVGDLDSRSEDRQLLLDALLAAKDHLVITYAGRDERSNAVLPPAVPLGELLDTIDATVRVAEAAVSAAVPRDQVVVHHPLQPFDPRNFESGAICLEGPWSFDEVALDGARACTGPRSGRSPFLAVPLPPAPAEVIELDDLVQLVTRPARAFLRQRLGVVVHGGDNDASDGLAIDLDALARWTIGQRLLDARLAGADSRACREAEVSRGMLPPGNLGEQFLDEVMVDVEALHAAVAALMPNDAGRPESISVNVELGGGRSLTGTVRDVFGEVARVVTYSKLGARHRLQSWVRFLVLRAAEPDVPHRALAIGRGPNGRVSASTIESHGVPIDGVQATVDRLRELVDLYDRGMRAPLPIYCKTSAAFASARARGKDPEAGARREWESDRFDLEDREPEHQLVLGGVVPFGDLLDDLPSRDECGEGWAQDEPTRLGRYARRLWDPLLQSERLETR